MIAWRIFDPRINALHSGDEIIAVDGVPTGDWLARTARLTFGGNARSRQAEAALNLGLGTQAVHEVAGLGKLVTLSVRPAHGAAYPVHLPYQPMTQPLAAAMAASVNSADLPDIVRAGPYRVGSVRIGAFAPQFDPVFTAAADAAPQSADAPDAAMLAGFCAVTRELIAHYDSIASHSDLMLVDLRGNMGGFGREVRAIAWAISGKPPITTYDVVAAPAGTVRLRAEPEDPSCGNVNSRKPLLVLVDAGTRSAGELLATYLWANGAIVLGERTVGAGGGRDAASTGIPTGVPGYRALISESFFLFDPKGEWHAGTMNETQFVARVAAQKFAPSRQRPYTTQAIGVLPDVLLSILWQDLRDNGSSLVARGIDAARQRGLLHK
jgi:C-terminal processing protease CtpA/Prc